MITSDTLTRAIITVAVVGMGLVVSGALVFQYGFGENPCPLCLLQRLGMFGIMVSGLMCLIFGPHPRYYALTLFSALFGGTVSARQILLHIDGPAGSGFGSVVMGFHLYTWAFIVFFVTTIGVGILMVLYRDREEERDATTPLLSRLNGYERFALVFVGTLLLVNTVGVFIECGWTACCEDGPCP